MRQWANERKQWGEPIGKHDPVAQKIAFIAGTAFGLEALVDVSSRLADDKQRDFRIEAAIAKLYGSERAWEVVDTMVQVRGGRGYETAKSLAARGEKPVPAEQMLRDMRINRIFEGSTEIMHLMIAREAVDQHLQIAGDILLGDGGVAEKAKLGLKAGAFYAKWFPSLTVGKGQDPRSFDEFGALAKHLRYAERSSRKLARSTFYAMGRYQAKLEQKGACWAGSSTSGPSYTRSPAPARMPRLWPRRILSTRTPSTSWPTCSATRLAAAPRPSSMRCGPTTTTISTRPPSRCSTAVMSSSRTTCSIRPGTVR